MLKRLILRIRYVAYKEMLSIRFFFLITCVSLTISIVWIQLIENNSKSINESLIEEALKNGARDYRFAEVYRKKDKLPDNMKYVLLWTRVDYAPFYYFSDGQRGFIEKNCSIINCFVTSDRNFFDGDTSKFHAIAFNGRSIYETSLLNLPYDRLYNQKYIFFNLESADNYPVCHSRYDDFFNWTATYRLDSDIPFPYIQIKNQKGEIVGPKEKMEWPELKDEEYDYRQNKSKAVAWFVSNCNSRSGRAMFARQLQKSLVKYGWSLDIYGACGPFKCPKHVKNNCEIILERDYYFYLSFENSFSKDYVTEKLLTPLQHNVVPIVLGGADYKRFLPPGSYLDATQTAPEILAKEIDGIINSPTLYNSFFNWKPFYEYKNPSTDDCVCALCAALNNETLFRASSTYKYFRSWWNPNYKHRCRT